MNFVGKFLSKAGPPVLAWALSMAIPAVPSGVWLALINGLIGGGVTLAHIQEFLAAHNIKTYSDPSDFPNPPPQSGAVNNISR